ncbi:MAG: hypothetical protein ABIK28_25630, partial [Planctomycetota bacterium]
MLSPKCGWIMACIILAVAGFAGCLIALEEESDRSQAQGSGVDPGASWMDQVQVYTHLALPLDTAKALGVTVNGLWNGWGMKSPVASMHPGMIFWRFRSDKSYVEGIHEQGMRHGSCLSNVYAHPSLIKGQPELAEATCKTINNDGFTMDGGWYLQKQPFMCQNSPAWQDALLNRAKRMIDAGTDAIVFDEPFGDTFFASLPVPGFPGFSDHDLACLAADLKKSFSPEELKERFGLESLKPELLLKKLAEPDPGIYLGFGEPDSSNAQSVRLWKRFRELQLASNYTIRKKLIESIRGYAMEKQGRITPPIGANLAELESYTLFNLQLPVLYLAGLFDFLAFEMAYRPHPRDRIPSEGADAFVLDYRGKWLAWYQLGEALAGPHRALAYPSQEMVNAWIGKEETINYLCHLL